MQQLEDPALRKEQPIHISRTYNLHPCAAPVNAKFMLGIMMVSGLYECLRHFTELITSLSKKCQETRDILDLHFGV